MGFWFTRFGYRYWVLVFGCALLDTDMCFMGLKFGYWILDILYMGIWFIRFGYGY